MSGPDHHENALDPELIAYALGELDLGERERVERRLAEDPDLRSSLTQADAMMAALSALPNEAWEPIEPPLLAVGAAAPVSPAKERARARRPRRAQPGLVAPWRARLRSGLAVAVLAVGVAIGIAIGSSSSGSSPATVATARLSPIGGADPSARGVFRLAADRTARLAVSGLAPTGSRHVYELWLMNSTSDLISVATFRVSDGGRADITLSLPVSPSHFRYLDISRQPLDGTAVHSDASVLRAPTQHLG